MNENRTVRATGFIQIEPEFSAYGNRDSADALRGAKTVAVTQNRSKRPKPGTIEVKVSFDIPVSAFLPLRPEAVVVVPESMTLPHPIEVQAEEPED